MVVICEIDFDNNPHGTYYAGQVLSGCVTLKVDKIKEVKAISLHIKGLVVTRWSETDSNRKTTDTYYGRENYISSVIYLMGSKANDEKLQLEAGIHSYKFTCYLPKTCPSSFEGAHGSVRYYVSVVFMRPWKFNQKYTKCFTVLKIMDLNYESPLLKMPVQIEVEKAFCCWPCQTEPLKLKLSLPQTGFVSGQVMPITVLVTNDSSIPVDVLKVTLVMLVNYYSQTPSRRTRTQRISVAKIKSDSVMRYTKKQFNYQMRVPATPPTCFNLCDLLQIVYQVEVVAKVKSWYKNEVARIPITIGNVPLLCHASGIVSGQPQGSVEPVGGYIDGAAIKNSLELRADEASKVQDGVVELTADGPALMSAVMPQNLLSPWAADADIPPPNYEEAMHMRYDISKIEVEEADDELQQNIEEYGETKFVPLYPVFNIPSPSALEHAKNVCDCDAPPSTASTWL